MLTILRLGHRPARDKRITTHVCLVARAFNADKILIDTKDAKLEETVNGVITRFGGPFEIETGITWRKVLRNWPGKIVHLTMYGEHIDNALEKVPISDDLLIVVGSEKVPREVYEEADFNIAIGNQPHSEVSALAVFLDRYFQGSGLKKEFSGELKIIGTPKGKKVIEQIVDRV
jgi:tRNA (cytidine56-2'-O)-methyltransferase